uniref:Uncharacterized protein n=1 Tax=Photinus pyralis TaxID=7054 RepID=A0A1Y1NBQ0_PHOPY
MFFLMSECCGTRKSGSSLEMMDICVRRPPSPISQKCTLVNSTLELLKIISLTGDDTNTTGPHVGSITPVPVSNVMSNFMTTGVYLCLNSAFPHSKTLIIIYIGSGKVIPARLRRESPLIYANSP